MKTKSEILRLPYIYDTDPEDSIYPHGMNAFDNQIMLFDANAWDELYHPCGQTDEMMEYNDFWRHHLPELSGKVPLQFELEYTTEPGVFPYPSVYVYGEELMDHEEDVNLWSLIGLCNFVWEYRGIKMAEKWPVLFERLSDGPTRWSYPLCLLSKDVGQDEWGKRPVRISKTKRS